MLTSSLIICGLAIYVLVGAIRSITDDDALEFEPIAAGCFCLCIGSGLLTLAFIYDLYGIWMVQQGIGATHGYLVPTATLILAISALGLASLFALIVRRWQSRKSEQAALVRRKGDTIRLILEILSFVSSVLGILSFYLQHGR